jgi:surface protein
MEREINKKLRNMKKSQLDKVCGKMKCPMGTKKEMIIRLLRPLRKYKMGNRRVSSLKNLSHDVIFPDFPKHMMDAENNYPPGVIDILLEGYKERCFHAKNETLRGAVKEYIQNKRSAIRKYGDISKWDVSKVTDMNNMFYNAKNFNGDLSGWDVSNVTNMIRMFYNAKNFNGDLSKWDVSKVTNMNRMFYNASSFNGDLSKWDVSKVTNMSKMFEYAEYFNGDLSKWNVSNVRDMSKMFESAESFNGDISEWNVSNVTDMDRMFYSASSFNGDISEWDVTNVTNMYKIFDRAESFDKRKNAPWYPKLYST